MKAKTLLSMAVAGALGASAAVYAGPNHSQWVAAGEEQYPAMNFASESPTHLAVVETVDIYVIEPVGGTFSGAEGSLQGSYSSDESLALDQGIYSDFIVASFPVTFESWDLYLIPEESLDILAMSDFQSGYDVVALSDNDFMILPHDLVLIESYSLSSDDESLG